MAKQLDAQYDSFHSFCSLFSIQPFAVGEVGSALHMSAEQFQQEYKSSQPSKNRDIVFYCMAGVRSLVAVELAHNLGYTK